MFGIHDLGGGGGEGVLGSWPILAGVPSPPPSSVTAVAVPQLVCFHVFPDMLFGSSLFRNTAFVSKHSPCFETWISPSQPQLVQKNIKSKPCLLSRLLSRASSALSRAGLISPWFHQRLHLRHPHTMPPFHAMPRKTYRIRVGKEIYVITSWLKSAVAPLHLIPPGCL